MRALHPVACALLLFACAARTTPPGSRPVPKIRCDFAPDHEVEATPRWPPRGREILSATLELQDPLGGPLPTLEGFRQMMEDSEPVPPCDPSIVLWSYVPWFRGEFVTAAGRFPVGFLDGYRAQLVWPDGEGTTVDSAVRYGWLPTALGGRLHRARDVDARCTDPARPRAIERETGPPVVSADDLAVLASRCKRADLGVTEGWCCPPAHDGATPPSR